MSKHKTREQWINLFKQYEINNQIQKEYKKDCNEKHQLALMQSKV